MSRFWSQHGEDYILSQLFKGQGNGFFIEVGALDGLRFSNTYVFELAGWTGLLFEPHPEYFAVLCKNRPRSICLPYAIDDTEGRATFFANYRGSLSTLDPQMEESFRSYGKYFGGFSKIDVQTQRIDTVLDDLEISTIDILSIDTEGTDFRSLKSIGKYRPRAIVIEETKESQEIGRYLQDLGYFLGTVLSNNHMYFLDSAMAENSKKVIGLEDHELHVSPNTVHPLEGE